MEFRLRRNPAADRPNTLAELTKTICWPSSAGLEIHASCDLHRRSASDRPPQGAARLLRLCGGRLVFAGDAAVEPERPGAAQAAPARAGRRRPARPLDHHHRREGVAAARARADRPLRHAARRRRDPRLPGRAGRRHPVHAVDDVDLLDRGRGGGGDEAVLVPALRHARSRLHARTDRARRGREVQRAGAHPRPADSRPAPLRHQERHDGAAGDQARQPRSTSPPSRPGRSRSSKASARPSAISPAT